METEYLDEEQVIALYNKVRTGKRTWPADIWSSPAALQYAVTVFDYWIHNVMGWKGWPDSRGKVTPALLEEHRLADLVESVFVPEFGDDWLDFEVVLNGARPSEDESSPDLSDRWASRGRVRHAFEQLVGSPKQQATAADIPPVPTTRCGCGARSGGAGRADKAEREAASSDEPAACAARGHQAEAWSIVKPTT
jgi:hypothetical protein